MHRSRIDGNQALPPENRHLDHRARGRFPPLRPSTPSTSRFGSFIAPVIRFELHLPSPSRSSSVSPQRTEATLSSLPLFLRLACQFEHAPAARPQAPRQAPRAALVTGLEQPRGRRTTGGGAARSGFVLFCPPSGCGERDGQRSWFSDSPRVGWLCGGPGGWRRLRCRRSGNSLALSCVEQPRESL